MNEEPRKTVILAVDRGLRLDLARGAGLDRAMSEYEKRPYVRGVGYTDRGFVERMTALLEDALNEVFQSICARMPVVSMHWGHMDPVGMQIEKLARADRTGITLLFARAQVGSECVHLLQPLDEPSFSFRYLSLQQGRDLRRYWAGLNAHSLLEVGEEDGELLELLRNISDERFEAPYYQIRLGPREHPLGGIGFQGVPSRPLTEEQKRVILDREVTLRMTLVACLQLWSIRTFQELRQPSPRQVTFRLEDMEERIIGARGSLKPIMELTRKVAPLDVSVLISGESGTGKEIIARAVHDLSPRADRPFVALNCGALPSGLLESELFGHSRGAFTGAVNSHLGCFERADGGTLFLDEVGELPPEAQVKFLRILEARVVERVGSNTPIPVDVRVIAATNRNLEEQVGKGMFRPDLWYRLRGVRLNLPPLRERREDIPALVQHFLKYAAARFHLPPHAVAGGEMDRLRAYAWPGNVRELRNMVEEALVRWQGQEVRFDMLAPFPGSVMSGPCSAVDPISDFLGVSPLASTTLEAGILARLHSALDASRGRIDGPHGAAAALGLKPSTLRSKLDRCGLAYGRRWTK